MQGARAIRQKMRYARDIELRGNIMTVIMHHAENRTPEISFTDAAVKHLVSYLQKNAEHVGIVYQ